MSVKLYVGNLPFSVTNEELKKLFASYGEIEESTIRASCTRTLGLNTDQFNDLIRKKEIVNFLKKRFPSKMEEIEQTLAH